MAGNIVVVCSHRRGDTTVLCCIAEVEDGKAITFQLQGVAVATDFESDYVFDSVEQARQLWIESDWPHA